MLVAGRDYDTWLEGLSNPVPSIKASAAANWQRKKDRVKRLTGQTTFFLGDRKAVTLNSTHRVHGGWSRSARIKSLRLYPEDAPNATEKISIFENETLENFNINLRNSGNSSDTQYIKDGVAHELIAGLSIATQRYAPKIIFLNGEYLGILNARDRKDHYYLAIRYGVNQDSVDLLKENLLVDSGSADAYKKLLVELKNKDPLSEEFPQYIAQHIDLNSFEDYFITSLYLARKDWPNNNIAYWRVNKPQSVSSASVNDGRWRWIAYDIDSSFSDQKTNMLELATKEGGNSWPNPDWSTFVFRTLLKNPNIQQQFITRYTDLINTTFHPERMISFIRNTEKRIEKEMPRHIARWKAPRTLRYWRRNINKMVTFAEKRPAIQRKHLQEFFDLGELYTLQVKVLVEDKTGHLKPMDNAAIIKLNTLTLGVSGDELEKPVAASARATNMEKYLALPWSGEYFAGMPITLTAEPRPGYRFSHWLGQELTEDEKYNTHLELEPEADITVTAVFVKDNEGA